MKQKFLAPMLLSALIVGGVSGHILAKNTVEPRVVYSERPFYIPYPYPVERVVKETVTVEVERTIREFASLEELTTWLSENSLLDEWEPSWTCIDFARTLQDKAIEDGFIMSFDIIYTGEYNLRFHEKTLEPGVCHAINSAIIGDKLYYIDKGTGEVAVGARLK